MDDELFDEFDEMLDYHLNSSSGSDSELTADEYTSDDEILGQVDLFTRYNDSEFNRKFRMTKQVFLILYNYVKQDLGERRRLFEIHPRNKLLICLGFFATNNPQHSQADIPNVNQSTISRIIKNVSKILARKCREYVFLPRGEEIEKIKAGFYKIQHFPNVIGAIDGSLMKVRIKKIYHNVFRDRHNNTSINILAACDHQMNFLVFVAR